MISRRCVLGLGLAGISLPAIASNNRWVSALKAFERIDRETPSERGSLLMVGSSSIARWTSADQDFAPLPVVRRGLGASRLDHMILFKDTLFAPHRPSVMVLYVGENDIAQGASPETVVRRLVELRAALADLPAGNVPHLFLSLKPSPARWRLWFEMQTANRLVSELAATTPGLTYVDVSGALLNAAGEPETGAFVADHLHLNAEGYRRWADLLRKTLAPESVLTISQPGG